jgi:hypothetical protein
MSTIRYDEAEVAEYLRRFHGKAKTETGIALSAAQLESSIVDAVKAADKAQDVCPRYRVRIISKRRRFRDPDAACAKWAIDGLVAGGVLPADSAQVVAEVVYSQEKSERDETVIEVYEVGKE